MGRIQRLPAEVVEKIAAGEVVERPASVVKELVENAIDAGAATISVDVAGGGSERIVVMDDGMGMTPEDLGACILRHATSKIAGADDLWNIRTMGFRGEALAAIGAVSRLAIESRQNVPEVIEGSRIEVLGGDVRGPIVAGCAGGTRVAVADLFYNVPARRKFLRSANVENGHISEVVTTYALAFPHIRFELSVDGARRVNLAACRQNDAAAAFSERALKVMGSRVGQLMPVSEDSPDISVHGFVAEGGRRGGKDIFFFLNGRPIRDRMLMHALAQGFGERMGAGQFPAAALWIEIDPAKVDVNVHPAKREVRFSDGGAIYSFLLAAVRKPVSAVGISIVAADPAPYRAPQSGVLDAVMRYEENRLARGPSTLSVRSGRGPEEFRQAYVPAKGRANMSLGALPTFPASSISVQIETALPTLSPIGQYALSYIVCEDPAGALVLIDQHAAHERLGFEVLRRAYARGTVPEQKLLIPEHVELGEKAAAYLVEAREKLVLAGFEIEPFGGGTVLVKAVPELLRDASVAGLMERLADEFEAMGEASSLEETMEKVFAVVACHRQVRAGDRLGAEELRALVRDIERENITSCPHGRPALVRIERDEIEKWFKRT
jgi:DNA mismatch repair protein MutL